MMVHLESGSTCGIADFRAVGKNIMYMEKIKDRVHGMIPKEFENAFC